jgi:RNA ligase
MKVDLEAFRDRERRGLLTLRPHREAPYLIANYTPECTYARGWDEVTLMARGLILDLDGNIVGRSFNKFFNFGEPGAADIDAGLFYPKFDGSLGVSYRMPDGTMRFATRGSFDSPQAEWATKVWAERFGEGIDLDDGYSFVVEIIYPDNRICVDYGTREDLVLLAVVRHDDGTVHDPRSSAMRWGWRGGVADRVDPEDLDEAVGIEGYVLREVGVTGVPKQVKYKTPWYLRLHRARAGLSLKQVYEVMAAGQDDVFFRDLPEELRAEAEGYAAQVTAELRLVETEVALEALAWAGKPRKDVAIALKGRDVMGLVLTLIFGGVRDSEKWRVVGNRLGCR